MDLQAYLDRIGYNKPVEATLDVLRAITWHHPTAIAFENLNPLLGLPVDITLPALEDKLVKSGRGGYCYEHNRLLLEALQLIGFEASGLSARVLFMRPDDTLPPRSHMLLRVNLEGAIYIVDAGFGGATPTAPLKLLADIEQETPHEPYRLLRDGDEWLVQVLKNGAWESMYLLDLQLQHPQDYTFPNYYLSTHPDSHFVNNLLVARPVPDGRVTVSNRQFSFHPKSGAPERRLINEASELKQILEKDFGIQTNGLPGLDNALTRLFALPTP